MRAIANLAFGQRFVGRIPVCGSALAKLSQQRSVAARAAQVAAANKGPVKVLHDEISERFHKTAQGKPPNVSAAQLVQMIFEVGAADPRKHDPSEVFSKLLANGFYRLSHPQKRDSYGPPPVPNVGLEECKRWATMLFLEQLKEVELHPSGRSLSAAEERAAQLRRGRQRGGPGTVAPACASAWCRCPPASSGTKHCCLEKLPPEVTPGTPSFAT